MGLVCVSIMDVTSARKVPHDFALPMVVVVGALFQDATRARETSSSAQLTVVASVVSMMVAPSLQWAAQVSVLRMAAAVVVPLTAVINRLSRQLNFASSTGEGRSVLTMAAKRLLAAAHHFVRLMGEVSDASSKVATGLPLARCSFVVRMAAHRLAPKRMETETRLIL